MSSDTRLCTRSRLGWTRLHATALALKLHMHKCAHNASASQLTCVQRQLTLHEISSRLDTAACNCTCTQTAYAQVCTRCKRILTDMCPAIPTFHKISSRLDTAACNCTCTQTAHAKVCTRCKRISTEMCPATPVFAQDLVSAEHGCIQLHLH